MKAGVKYLSCDFETTVYENQTETEVWAAACVELFTEDVFIFHSIDELFNYFVLLDSRVIAYFHNLKFDGAFWLSYLLKEKKFEQALNKTEKDGHEYYEWIDDYHMKNKTFKYMISDMGQWYTIKIRMNNKLIEIRDSLKLLPFSVERIGQSFKTKHKKLDMEYTGKRFAGCEITNEEREYIKNDVLVVKEALEMMYQEGHDKLTIGSCCMNEFKRGYYRDEYKRLFPNLYDMPLNEEIYGAISAGEYIKNSYRGGWCYVVPEKANKIIHNGLTADVNSLYPSMMHSSSRNPFPLGSPIFWHGNFIPRDATYPKNKYHYYFIRIKTRFYLKQGKLPCIQVKNNLLYPARTWLTTSDIYRRKDNTYHKYYIDTEGIKRPARVELTLTCTDFELIKEHYNLVDFEVLDGCYFPRVMPCDESDPESIFDRYIEKYKKIKQTSTGAIREQAKLFLNNLYGKMATSTKSSFKIAKIKEDGSLGYITIDEYDKKPGYIAIGSAITSYARNFTIRAAQKNFHGANERGFIYADTDSIHCDLTPEELIDIPVHDSEFSHWKLESFWNIGWFVRPKTYIEHVTHENQKPIDEPYYNVKCAGLNKRGKDLFLYSIGDEITVEKIDKWLEKPTHHLSEDEAKFIKVKRELEDFTLGIEIPGKLRPVNISGGIVLEETTFKMR